MRITTQAGSPNPAPRTAASRSASRKPWRWWKSACLTTWSWAKAMQFRSPRGAGSDQTRLWCNRRPWNIEEFKHGLADVRQHLACQVLGIGCLLRHAEKQSGCRLRMRHTFRIELDLEQLAVDLVALREA